MKSQNLIQQLERTAESMKKCTNRVLAEIGLTHGQAAVLGYLSSNADRKITQKDIENEFCLTHATVNGFMSRMEKKGLLTTRQDTSDRRYKVVEPTNLMKSYFEIAKEIFDRFKEELDSCMSAEEQKKLADLLEKMLVISENYIEKIVGENGNIETKIKYEIDERESNNEENI